MRTRTFRKRAARGCAFFFDLGLLCALAVASANAQATALNSTFGAADVSAASGNGGLTVSLNASGRVSGCAWPRPGCFDQVTWPSLPGTPQDLSGVSWGVKTAGRMYWITGAPWKTEQTWLEPGIPIIVTKAALEEPGIHAEQTTFVHPEMDLLVMHIEVTGAIPDALGFLADFTPCTRLLPEWPGADTLLDALNDFAAFTDSARGRVCHFRPEAPGAGDYLHANELATRNADPGEWARFGPGIWILCGGTQPAARLSCGAAGASALESATDVTSCAAVGQTVSCMEFTPGASQQGWHATVFAAFGGRYESVAQLLDTAGARGYQRLRDEARQAWSARMDACLLPKGRPELRQALATLFLAADRQSGAILRAPVSHVPWAVDLPRESVTAGLALELAGAHEAADRHLRFLAAAVRKTDMPGRPYGSMPVALYADGHEAAPGFLLDLDTAAWFLMAVWRHHLVLGEEQRPAFLTSLREDVARATEFLERWTRGTGNGPLPTFQPGLLRDASSITSMVTAYAGLQSALLIAEAAGDPVPPVRRQNLRDLEAALQLRFSRLQAPWDFPPVLAWWIDPVIPAGHWLRSPLRVAGTEWTPLPGRVPPALPAAPDAMPETRAAALLLIDALAGS